MGYEVTIFEAFHIAGGVLVYGIPEFRLPKAIVGSEVEKLQKLGVNIMTDMIVGKTLSIDELFADYGYKAVYVGTGAGLPMFMNIPGEGLAGVCSANEYLTRINLMKGFKPEYDTPVLNSKTAAIVGGGNAAMDACRCAKRLGAEKVYVIYRRGMEELPARREEVEHALEEGIDFQTLCNPIEIMPSAENPGHVGGIKCIRMELGGLIVSDDEVTTTREGVFAGGDAVTGAATVILAMGAGKKAAVAIDKYLQNK